MFIYIFVIITFKCLNFLCLVNFLNVFLKINFYLTNYIFICVLNMTFILYLISCILIIQKLFHCTYIPLPFEMYLYKTKYSSYR